MCAQWLMTYCTAKYKVQCICMYILGDWPKVKQLLCREIYSRYRTTCGVTELTGMILSCERAI